MSSSAAGYVTSLARQQHLPPPKVLETLSSNAVTNGHALDKMCTFLASEKAKLSHLDLQQHWSDLHGVATTLCSQQEEHPRLLHHGGEGDAGCHARALQQMMLDVEAIRSGGYDESTTPSGTSSRHVHFPRDDDDADDEAVGESENITSINLAQHNGKLSKEKESKKQAKKKKEKKEMKKAAKRERKEAKKRLKKEARKKAKP
jgi:hypothetical protein